MGESDPLEIGVLALQGDVSAHVNALQTLGTTVRYVRSPRDLEGLSGIILPGGESTTLSMLLESSGIFDPLASALGEGMAAFGTCAGLILLSTQVADGRADQRSFGAIDCTVRRNGYGRQLQSFQKDIDLIGAIRDRDQLNWKKECRETPNPDSSCLGQQANGEPNNPTVAAAHECFPGIFIRAPVIASVGAGVEVLGVLDNDDKLGGTPVLCSQGNILVSSFHPELTSNTRIHRYFLEMVHRSRVWT